MIQALNKRSGTFSRSDRKVLFGICKMLSVILSYDLKVKADASKNMSPSVFAESASFAAASSTVTSRGDLIKVIPSLMTEGAALMDSASCTIFVADLNNMFWTIDDVNIHNSIGIGVSSFSFGQVC